MQSEERRACSQEEIVWGMNEDELENMSLQIEIQFRELEMAQLELEEIRKEIDSQTLELGNFRKTDDTQGQQPEIIRLKEEYIARLTRELEAADRKLKDAVKLRNRDQSRSLCDTGQPEFNKENKSVANLDANRLGFGGMMSRDVSGCGKSGFSGPFTMPPGLFGNLNALIEQEVPNKASEAKGKSAPLPEHSTITTEVINPGNTSTATKRMQQQQQQQPPPNRAHSDTSRTHRHIPTSPHQLPLPVRLNNNFQTINTQFTQQPANTLPYPTQPPPPPPYLPPGNFQNQGSHYPCSPQQPMHWSNITSQAVPGFQKFPVGPVNGMMSAGMQGHTAAAAAAAAACFQKYPIGPSESFGRAGGGGGNWGLCFQKYPIGPDGLPQKGPLVHSVRNGQNRNGDLTKRWKQDMVEGRINSGGRGNL